MFVILVGNRVNWNRPPVITLLLIVINCAVFFFLQTDDGGVGQISEAHPPSCCSVGSCSGRTPHVKNFSFDDDHQP
ncbi:hypothetical protein [Methylomagnum sp.]